MKNDAFIKFTKFTKFTKIDKYGQDYMISFISNSAQFMEKIMPLKNLNMEIKPS